MSTWLIDAPMKPAPPTHPQSGDQPVPDWLNAVRGHVAGLRYGLVQVTVHGGKVVQVERTERFRFEGSAHPQPAELH